MLNLSNWTTLFLLVLWLYPYLFKLIQTVDGNSLKIKVCIHIKLDNILEADIRASFTSTAHWCSRFVKITEKFKVSLVKKSESVQFERTFDLLEDIGNSPAALWSVCVDNACLVSMVHPPRWCNWQCRRWCQCMFWNERVEVCRRCLHPTCGPWSWAGPRLLGPLPLVGRRGDGVCFGCSGSVKFPSFFPLSSEPFCCYNKRKSLWGEIFRFSSFQEKKLEKLSLWGTQYCQIF